jgi:hypothetical protein
MLLAASILRIRDRNESSKKQQLTPMKKLILSLIAVSAILLPFVQNAQAYPGYWHHRAYWHHRYWHHGYWYAGYWHPGYWAYYGGGPTIIIED